MSGRMLLPACGRQASLSMIGSYAKSIQLFPIHRAVHPDNKLARIEMIIIIKA
jgi:hypothetical protein